MNGTGLACEGLRDVAAELAVGDLSGDERAEAVRHLAACADCRDLVGELTAAAEGLLLLAPELEPKPGFEPRVLARLDDRARPRRRVRLRSLAAVAAAIVVAAAGGAVVANAVDHQGAPSPVRTALAISASGRSTCRVVISGRDPSSVVISLDGPPGSSSDYVAEVQPAKGAPIPLGSFALTDGHGLLARTVHVDAAELRSVRVFDTRGKLLYETFPAPVASR